MSAYRPHPSPPRDPPAKASSPLLLLEGSSEACGAIDRTGRCLYVNREAERVLGQERAALLGQLVWDAFPAAARDIANREAQRALTEDVTTSVRVPWPPLHGWFEVRACPSEIGLLLYLRDVTAEVEAEREKRRLRSELAEESRKLSDLHEKMRAEHSAAEGPPQVLDGARWLGHPKDRFVAVLSHELRTPLTPVLMAVSVMQRDPSLSPQVKKYLGMIRRNIALEARLIDDLLDVTKLTRNTVHLDLCPTQVHALIQGALELFGADIADKKLEVRLDLSATTDRVSADPARLHQVLWNLIKNAIKFTPSGGHILVRSDNPRPGALRVEVRDDGIGIAPALLPRIFNAFEQGEEMMTRRFGGLGVGLSIARALVELHGGSIEAHSDGEGRGACFSVLLPVDPALVPAGDSAPVSGHDRAQPSARVLVVDDHGDTLEATQRLLLSLGYAVETASSVAEARAVLRARPVDVLISDLALPDATGHDLMRGERAQSALPGIALSGFGMAEDIQRSKEAGFSAHLTKPVDPRLLDATIRELLDRNRNRNRNGAPEAT